MAVLNELNRRAHRFGIVDVKLASVSALFAGLLVAKLFPELLTASAWWYVLLAVACAFHPLLVLFARDGKNATTEAHRA